jgi:hypothetical protein
MAVNFCFLDWNFKHLTGENYIPMLDKHITRVEAGSNTSTVNLRVVRGDEMGLKKAAP